MSPLSGSFKTGDVLTCMSDGYPQPSYQWTDSDGVVVSSGPNITLTTCSSSFFLNCTATGSLEGVCSASAVVQGYGM